MQNNLFFSRTPLLQTLALTDTKSPHEGIHNNGSRLYTLQSAFLKWGGGGWYLGSWEGGGSCAPREISLVSFEIILDTQVPSIWFKLPLNMS